MLKNSTGRFRLRDWVFFAGGSIAAAVATAIIFWPPPKTDVAVRMESKAKMSQAQLRELLAAIEEKHRLVTVLNACIDAPEPVLVQIGVGLWVGRRLRGTTDFFVAGRRLPAPLVFATFLAANIGAGSTIGASSLGYSLGLGGWWWNASAGLGSLVFALWAGPKMPLPPRSRAAISATAVSVWKSPPTSRRG
jgi:hypothetical protein